MADVLPYFVPAPGTVIWEPWQLFDGQEWSALPDEIDGWDPGTDLEVARRVRVDGGRLRDETGLDLADVVLAVSWTSSTTSMTDAAPLVSFDQDGSAIAHAALPGERISGLLKLRSTISMVRPPTSYRPGVAWIPGSVLSEHTHQVLLDSSSSMFPTHEIDFAGTRLSPEASWHLETTTDMSAAFFATFRVLINKRDTELSRAVARGAKDRRQQALLDELESGVAELLLEIAVHCREELDERADWPSDSVGDVLSRIVRSSRLTQQAPSTPQELADFRTALTGAVRAGGKGRVFQ
ncbi:hypothetical protein AB0M02_41990 [Actinoplanes sp. NPDC051861]|uniref:hypothetical protein n=1 Tax=Actinoplanes sp. NPDC051861 TaxID=3155170 RepID=UPI003421C63B